MSDGQDTEREFQLLVTSFLEGDLSAEQTRRLRDLLASEASRRATYRQQAVLHALLLWRRGVSVGKDAGAISPSNIASLLEEVEEELQRHAAEQQPTTTRNEAALADFRKKRTEWERRCRNRRAEPLVIPWAVVYGAVGSIAAAILFFAYSLFLHSNSGQPTELVQTVPDPVVVASLSESVDAQWAFPLVAPHVGAPLQAGEYELGSGVVQLKFASGANTVIESPAKFTLISRDRVALAEGRLFGSVPKQALGFAVETPQATLIDLGTEFGIDVEADSEESEFHVLHGIVEVCVTTTQADDPEHVEATTRRRLTEGFAIQVDKQGRMESVAVNADRFCRKVPSAIATGRSEPPESRVRGFAVTGSIEVSEHTPPSLVGGTVTSNDTIRLFHEQVDLTLSQPLEVNAYSPAGARITSEQWRAAPRGTIPAGTRVSVYLLHFNPDSSDSGTQQLHQCSGTVTFPQPILGLIYTDADLHATDQMVGNGSTQYGPLAGEGTRGIATAQEGDRIEVSDDAHTLKINLTADRGADQIRVVTAAPEDDRETKSNGSMD